ncbi:MAG: hypothetical protein ACI3VA_04585 [Candidatus Limivicinus sp.]
MMEKKKKSGLFYFRFLLVYVLIVLGVIAFLMTKVWGFAEEYEAARPAHTMDAYVEDLNNNLWNDQVAQAIADMPHEVQSDEDCAQVIKDMLSAGITYVRAASSGGANTINYALRCGDKVIGNVTLIEDSSLADQVKYGMLPWIVSSAEFDFSGLYSSVEVTVPKSYTVKLNGVALGSEYIIEDDIQFSLLKDYYSSYPKLPVMVTYRFEHIIGELEPEILDENGNVTQIDESQGEEQFLNNCSEEELAKLTDFTERFAERYQSYNAGIGGDPATVYANRIAGYIMPGSDLEFRMKAVQDGLGWAHTNSIDIHYTTLNSAVSFGGGVYLCDFSSAFTTNGINGTQDFENNIKMIVIDKTGDMSDLRVAEMSQYKKDAEESQ